MNRLLTAIKRQLEEVRANGFIKSVAVLAGGTAFAQAITLLVLPILTRLYSPEDFTLLAVYSSIVGIISVVACLRLEIAIPLPERNEDAASLFVLSLIVSACFGLVVALITAVWANQIIEVLKQPALYPYLYLLPLGIWLASSYSAVQYWATRKKNFSVIARTRMAQSLLGSGTQTGMGVAGYTPFGLLLGQFLLSGVGFVGLLCTAVKEDIVILRKVRWQNMRAQLLIYDKFPKYSTLDSFANTAAIQIPLIIIAGLAIGPEAGYLLLAMRVMAAPMSLIGGAVSEAYLSHAADEHRAGTLGSFTASVVAGLLKVGVGPLIFIGIVSPIAFSWVFGTQWQKAGDLVSLMVPWMVLQLIASSISMCIHVRGWQRAMLVLMVIGLVMRVGSVLLSVAFGADIVSYAYILSGVFFYGIYCAFCFFCSGVSLRQLATAVVGSSKITTIWILAGILFVITSNYLLQLPSLL